MTMFTTLQSWHITKLMSREECWNHSIAFLCSKASQVKMGPPIIAHIQTKPLNRGAGGERGHFIQKCLYFIQWIVFSDFITFRRLAKTTRDQRRRQVGAFDLSYSLVCVPIGTLLCHVFSLAPRRSSDRSLPALRRPMPILPGSRLILGCSPGHLAARRLSRQRQHWNMSGLWSRRVLTSTGERAMERRRSIRGILLKLVGYIPDFAFPHQTERAVCRIFIFPHYLYNIIEQLLSYCPLIIPSYNNKALIYRRLS